MINWESGDGGNEEIVSGALNGEVARLPARRSGRWQRSGDPRHKVRPDHLRWTRRFAGTPDQVGAVRRFVAGLFADSADADEVAWVASELATNAISYSRSGEPGGSFEVQVMRGQLWADVRVIDAGGSNTPTIRLPDGDDELAEQGRGLYAIGFVALRYGTFVRRDGHRVVWIHLPAASQSVVGAQ